MHYNDSHFAWQAQSIQTASPFPILTCFGVDREEILRVACSDAVTQTTGSGGEVRVLRLDTDDGHILRRVLHDNWVVDRVRGEGSVIIDILYLRQK